MEEKFYFLYETKNLINNNIYIGVHITDDLNDGYLGSGLRLRRAIDKYGEINFEKTILEFFSNKEDMFNREKEIVNEAFLKRDDVYNLAVGGNGGFRGEEASSKQRLKMKGRKATEETRNKMSIYRRGRPLSDNHRKAVKEGAIKRSNRIKSGEIKSPTADKVKIHKDLTIKYVNIDELTTFIGSGWELGLPEQLKYKCGHSVSKEQIEKQQEKNEYLLC